MLTDTEKANLLLTKWIRIDMPSKFRYCWRIGPIRWLVSAGIYRKIPTWYPRVKRSYFKSFHIWSIGILWFEVWWYRGVKR